MTPDELMGQPFVDYIHADGRQAATFQINERRTGSRSTKRLTVRAFGKYARKTDADTPAVDSDPVFLVDAEGLYFPDESGAKVFVGTQGIARDITEHRRMESARLESEDRLLLALDVSGAGIWELNLKTGRVHVDERISNLLGYRS